jgi:hypothetical protein
MLLLEDLRKKSLNWDDAASDIAANANKNNEPQGTEKRRDIS